MQELLIEFVHYKETTVRTSFDTGGKRCLDKYIYLYKHYNYGDITDIMARFVDGVLFNGSSIKIYNT